MSVTESIYIIMFSSGLFGGLGHCIGMCGPIVASYSVAIKNQTLTPHILYNLGRITTYTLLGGLAGMTGSLVGIVGDAHGLQKFIRVFSGAIVVIMGMSLAGWLPFMHYFRDNENALNRFLSKLKSPFSGKHGTASLYPVGIFLGFLPCGLVYTALATTIRASMEAENHFIGFIDGSLLMFMFGLGTIPSLLLFGKIVNMLGLRIRERLYRLSAVLMIIIGIMFILIAV